MLDEVSRFTGLSLVILIGMNEGDHWNKIEMQVEFGKIEDFYGQFPARRVRGSQSVGFLPDTLFGIVGRFKFARVVQGRLTLRISSTSFSKSSRDGFCPEIVRKKVGNWATSFSSLRT
jgi:hypothetical protein